MYKVNDINEYLKSHSKGFAVFVTGKADQGLRGGAQVSLLTLMVGNLLEKSLALAAIFTATWRATAL